jgi:hypothetical protein
VAISLLACLITSALWTSGYRATDSFIWAGEGSEVSVESARGTLGFTRCWLNPWRGTLAAGFHHTRGRATDLAEHYGPADAGGWRFLGFGYHASGTFDEGAALITRTVLVPAWSLFASWLFLSFRALASLKRLAISVRRDGRANRGQCPECGYDLRVTPCTCPECGAGVAFADEKGN